MPTEAGSIVSWVTSPPCTRHTVEVVVVVSSSSPSSPRNTQASTPRSASTPAITGAIRGSAQPIVIELGNIKDFDSLNFALPPDLVSELQKNLLSVDFLINGCLIVEIDGDSHYSEDGIARDAVRTAFLAGEGYRLLRFSNLEVMENEEAVYLAVVEALGASGPTPSRPPPSRGR